MSLLISGAPEEAIAQHKKDYLLAGLGTIAGIKISQENVDDLLSDLGF